MAKSSGIIYLPLAAMISALFMPPMGGSISATMQTLFLPLAWPTRKAGLLIRDRLLPEQSVDPLSPNSPRTNQQLIQHNKQLLNELSVLREQLNSLEQRSAQLKIMNSDLREIIQPAAVVGASPDHRKTLMITATNMSQIRLNAAVVHPMGFVGRIDAVGLAGGNARVLLMTDPSSRVTGKFMRYVTRADGTFKMEDLDLDRPLVEGTTTGLVARQMKTQPIREKLQIGDWVILDDQQQFPQPALRGSQIGMVSKINFPVSDARLTEVEITPVTDYSLLPEVMVVVK